MFICQIRGNLLLAFSEKWQSRAKFVVERKGVETRRQTSDSDEGIVQTSNLKGVVKTMEVSITDWSLVQTQLPPPSCKSVIKGITSLEADAFFGRFQPS